MPKTQPVEQQLCFSIYAAEHAFTRFYRPLLAPLGLSYPQYLVMLVLWETDGLTVTQIGERLFLDSGTLTPLLRRMEQQGLLTRQRDAADARRVHVALTRAGRALEQEAAAFPRQLARMAGCTAAEIAALRQMLFEVRAALDAAA